MANIELRELFKSGSIISPPRINFVAAALFLASSAAGCWRVGGSSGGGRPLSACCSAG